MLSTTMSQFGIDQIEWLKWWLLIPLYVLSTVGVWFGVWLEEKWPETKALGWRLLLVSLAAETFFGALIFVADGRVSRLQREQIATLEDRLAARSLSGDEMRAMAASLTQYAGQPFEIVTYDDDQEAVSFAETLRVILKGANWVEKKPLRPVGLAGVVAGVVVYVSFDRPEGVRKAAWAIVSALKANQIAATVRAADQPDTLINVTVGIKP